MGNRPKELTLTHTKLPSAFDRRAAVAANFDVVVGMKIMAAAVQREAFGGLGGREEALNYLLSSVFTPSATLHTLRSRQYRYCIEDGG